MGILYTAALDFASMKHSIGSKVGAIKEHQKNKGYMSELWKYLPPPANADIERDIRAKRDEYRQRLPDTKDRSWLSRDLKSRYHWPQPEDGDIRLLYYKLMGLSAVLAELDAARNEHRDARPLPTVWIEGLIKSQMDNILFQEDFDAANKVNYCRLVGLPTDYFEERNGTEVPDAVLETVAG
jgi:hypothetical protein